MFARRCAPTVVGRLAPPRVVRTAPPAAAGGSAAPSLAALRPLPSPLYPSIFSLHDHFSPTLLFKRWATKKAAGVSNNNRKSNPKYLGVKKSHGELVIKGNIILKQRGKEFHPKGDGIGIGKDHSLFALIDGRVKFSRIRLPKPRRFVSVIPHERVSEAFPRLKLPAIPPVLSPPSKRIRKRTIYAALHAVVPLAEPTAVTSLAVGTPRPVVRAGPSKFAVVPPPTKSALRRAAETAKAETQSKAQTAQA